MSDELAVILAPAPMEYGIHREQYDALIQELEEAGIHAQVEHPVEERGIPDIASTTAREFYELVITVGTDATAILGAAALIEMVRRRLKGRKKRRAKILLPDGSEHVFDLDGD